MQEELGDYLADSDLVLDGGSSEVGVESTIIDCTSGTPRILRPGAITVEMIEAATGVKVSESTFKDFARTDIRVSGSFDGHYSPKARVFLDQLPVIGSGLIALDRIETPPGVVRLAAPKSVDEFAQVLYSALREGDHQRLNAIYIFQPAGDGLAIAVRDRLFRSAKGGEFTSASPLTTKQDSD